MQRNHPIAVRESRTVSGVEIGFSGQTLGEQHVMLFKLDVKISHLVSRLLHDRTSIDETLHRDQHTVHEHRMTRILDMQCCLCCGSQMRLICLMVLLVAAGSSHAVADVLAFESYTPASERPLLTRTYAREPVTISGTLSLPTRPGPYERNGKLPAVILMHGTGGILRDREPAWAQRFNEWGIAALYVDSFTARGVRPPLYAGTPQFIPSSAHIVDAYRALQMLARHPRIDRSRVVVMGFSRGGEVTLSSMFDRFRHGSLDDPSLSFAGHIALYPYCTLHYRGKEVTAAPLLMLLGGADDMTSPMACQHQADWLKARTSVKVVVYPGANHDFDRSTRVGYDINMVGIRNCEAEYDVDTFVIRWREGVPFRQADWLAECRYHGAHVGGDAAALKGSIDEVHRFLALVFQ
jgi:dienelactone hydrolase